MYSEKATKKKSSKGKTTKPNDHLLNLPLPPLSSLIPPPPPPPEITRNAKDSFAEFLPQSLQSSKRKNDKDNLTAENIQASFGINPNTDIFDLTPNTRNFMLPTPSDSDLSAYTSIEIPPNAQSDNPLLPALDDSSRWFSISNLQVTNNSNVAPPPPAGILITTSRSSSSKVSQIKKSQKKSSTGGDRSSDGDFNYEEAARNVAESDDEFDFEDNFGIEDAEQIKETLRAVEGEEEDEESGGDEELMDESGKEIAPEYGPSSAISALRKKVQNLNPSIEERAAMFRNEGTYVLGHLNPENKLLFLTPLTTFTVSTSFVTLQSRFPGICCWNDNNSICFSLGHSLRLMNLSVYPKQSGFPTFIRHSAEFQFTIDSDNLSLACDMVEDFSFQRTNFLPFAVQSTSGVMDSRFSASRKFVCCDWSPLGLLQYDGSALLCIQNDHRVILLAHCKNFPHDPEIASTSLLQAGYFCLADISLLMRTTFIQLQFDFSKLFPNFKSHNLVKALPRDEHMRLLLISSISCCWSSIESNNSGRSCYLFIGTKLGCITIWKFSTPLLNKNVVDSFSLAGLYFVDYENGFSCADSVWISSLKTVPYKDCSILCIGRSDGRIELCELIPSGSSIKVERKLFLPHLSSEGPITNITVKNIHLSELESVHNVEVYISEELILIGMCQQTSIILVVVLGHIHKWVRYDLPVTGLLSGLCFSIRNTDSDILLIECVATSDAENLSSLVSKLTLTQNDIDLEILSDDSSIECRQFSKHIEHISDSITANTSSKISAISCKGISLSPCGAFFSLVTSTKMNSEESNISLFIFPYRASDFCYEKRLVNYEGSQCRLVNIFPMNIYLGSIFPDLIFSYLRIADQLEEEFREFCSKFSKLDFWEGSLQKSAELGLCKAIYVGILKNRFVKEETKQVVELKLKKISILQEFIHLIKIIEAAISNRSLRTSGLLAADWIVQSHPHMLIDDRALQRVFKFYERSDCSFEMDLTSSLLLKTSSADPYLWLDSPMPAELVKRPSVKRNDAISHREICLLCDAEVFMESLVSATCVNGHLFDRSLSTLRLLTLDSPCRFFCTTCSFYFSSVDDSSKMSGMKLSTSRCPVCLTQAILL